MTVVDGGGDAEYCCWTVEFTGLNDNGITRPRTKKTAAGVCCETGLQLESGKSFGWTCKL
jgi:hypothetical protein